MASIAAGFIHSSLQCHTPTRQTLISNQKQPPPVSLPRQFVVCRKNATRDYREHRGGGTELAQTINKEPSLILGLWPVPVQDALSVGWPVACTSPSCLVSGGLGVGTAITARIAVSGWVELPRERGVASNRRGRGGQGRGGANSGWSPIVD